MSTLHSKIVEFPQSPGVYLMKDTSGEILYIGKAKNLKSRVFSYFSSEKDGRYQIQFLMKKVSEIEPILTANEKEALLLENTLIKKYQPKYNLFLKDDKNYLSLKLNLQHPYPRLIVTRYLEKDGSLYFGPYPSGFKAREVADFIEEHFKLRTCTEKEFSNRVRPCLQYQIKRCDAPCVDYISKENYSKLIQQVRLFLEGKNRDLIQSLKNQMDQFSENLQFEEAARVRDLMSAIEVTLEKQKVANRFGSDHDVIGFCREGERTSFVILFYRDGNLSGRKHYFFRTPQESKEVLSSFLLQYYKEALLIPKEILIPYSLEDQISIQEILSEIKKSKVVIKPPEKGEKFEQIQMANQNAEEKLKRELQSDEAREEVLTNLQEKLSLSRLPRKIECYDISNIQGKLAVGSMVCFVDGKPAKQFYRKFKIKTVDQANDFAMIYEVLIRRLSQENWVLPDLMIIDGGKGQLGAAEAALKDKNVLNVDLVSLAKERDEKRPERIFLLNRKDPIILKPNSSELHLFVQLRDEAHRFGITFHRALRGKESLSSILDNIEGIGPSRKKNLLKHFGTVQKMSQATMEELLLVKGMSEKLAKKVYEKLWS